MKKPSRFNLDTLFNVALVAALVYFATMPTGPIGSRLASWKAERVEVSLVANHWKNLAATTSRVSASPTGPTAMVMFGDYQCRFCRQAHPHVKAVAGSSQLGVLAYRHLPVTSPKEVAEDAALAAICAEFQGRFAEMNDLLYEFDFLSENPDWSDLAVRAGVPDREEFSQCHTGPAARDRLAEDVQLAASLGIGATPSFVFPFGRRAGYLELSELEALVERAVGR